MKRNIIVLFVAAAFAFSFALVGCKKKAADAPKEDEVKTEAPAEAPAEAKEEKKEEPAK